jgi:hypothetical protein
MLLVKTYLMLQNAVAYVFGSTFVCRNKEAAKEVFFNSEIIEVTLGWLNIYPVEYRLSGSYFNVLDSGYI